MKDIDNLNVFASYSVQNAVGCFNEFTNAGSFITIHRTAKTRKSCELIAALQDTIDRTVRDFLGFGKNMVVDVGERS
ncbi:MAG TPA: hypothetical protein VE422_11500 [Terriglobia bacterium]|nr:hypothetical protein [Terriglobia bacterium]